MLTNGEADRLISVTVDAYAAIPIAKIQRLKQLDVIPISEDCF